MSVAGISASSFFAGLNSPAVQNKFQQIKKGFNSWARIFNPATCPRHKMIFPLCSNCSPTSSKRQRRQLAQDLKTGNLSAAQSDFSTLQQDLKQGGAVTGHRHHHLHAENSQSTAQQTGPATLFGDLSQELQTGNLTAAQQTYSALQQDFLQFTGGNGSSATSGSSNSASGLSVSA